MYTISYSFNSVDVLKFVRNGLKEKQETLLKGKRNNNVDLDFFQDTLKEKVLAALMLDFFLCVLV